jgi:hypothetical protein
VGLVFFGEQERGHRAVCLRDNSEGIPRASIQDIPPAKIRESKTKPGHIFVEAKLAELSPFVPGTKDLQYVATVRIRSRL